MKKTRILAIMMVVVLCAASLVGCGGKKGYTANNTEYVIGLTGPFTGDNAVYGTAVQNSAKMAVDEINAAGGLNGIKFKLVAKDDVSKKENVPAAYMTMLEDGMQVSLGTVTTAPGLEYANLSAEDNVFFLTPSASGDDIPKNDNGFQMCFADGNQGSAAAKYVNDGYKGQTIGVFYRSDDPYSKGIFDQFMENLDSSVTVVESSFTGANETDFKQNISTLKDCKFIFMPIYYGPASTFMTQAKEIMAPDAIYYGCDGFDGLESALDITTIPQEINMLSHFNSKGTDKDVVDFVKKYTDKYGTDTLNQFGASAYDCVYAIFNAMKAAIDGGKDIPVTISASDLCDILKEEFNGGFTYSGVTGKDITWDENGYVQKSADKYSIKEATK